MMSPVDLLNGAGASLRVGATTGYASLVKIVSTAGMLLKPDEVGLDKCIGGIITEEIMV